MSESVLPKEVVAFIKKHIDSVALLEVLLILYKKRDQALSIAEIDQTLRSNPSSIERALERLKRHSLAEKLTAPTGHYRYQASDSQMDEVVRLTAEVYAKYRLRVVDLIYAPPQSKAQSFAEAFRLRKEGGDDG